MAGFGMMPCWKTPTLHGAMAHTVLFLVTTLQCFGPAQPEARFALKDHVVLPPLP